jgi:hypothetical protein
MVIASPAFERYNSFMPDIDIPHLATERVYRALVWQGFALVPNLGDLSDATDLARRLGTVRPHRDANATGATIISAERPSDISAGQAFTREAMPPHTDGSGVPEPATIIVNVMLSPASRGGSAVLVDGQGVLEDLAREAPDALATLQDPTLFSFGAARLHAAVVDVNRYGRLTLRWRADGALEIAPAARQATSVFGALMLRHARLLALRAGDAYVLDNTRWLHGRSAYSGQRTVARLLVDAPSYVGGIELMSAHEWTARAS